MSASCFAEVRCWILTFRDIADLHAQVKVAGLAVGILRTTRHPSSP